VAFADHVSVVPESVPLADPETWIFPRQVALNVPDPEFPVCWVTVQLKLTQDS
jgi:hypothetical protein